MTRSKRVFDLSLALFGLAIMAMPAVLIILALLISQGRPVFYLSMRMQTPDRAFFLRKFRTMVVTPTDSGVSGGDKTGRITKLGLFLRRSRLDELPQLWNILRGDISFVGPRPPLQQYVEQFPDLYARVLQCRPGLTGLATYAFHHHEETLLAACTTAAETDAVYIRRCLPRKAQLDVIYLQNQSMMLDIVILQRTFARLFKKRRRP